VWLLTRRLRSLCSLFHHLVQTETVDGIGCGSTRLKPRTSTTLAAIDDRVASSTPFHRRCDRSVAASSRSHSIVFFSDWAMQPIGGQIGIIVIRVGKLFSRRPWRILRHVRRGLHTVLQLAGRMTVTSTMWGQTAHSTTTMWYPGPQRNSVVE